MLKGKRVLALTMPGILDDLDGLQLIGMNAEAVLLGGADEGEETGRVFSYLNLNRAFLELQADLTGSALRRVDRGEATTRGVGAIAAVGAGLAGSVEAIVRRDPDATFAPKMSADLRRQARDRHRRLLDLVTSADALELRR